MKPSALPEEWRTKMEQYRRQLLSMQPAPAAAPPAPAPAPEPLPLPLTLAEGLSVAPGLPSEPIPLPVAAEPAPAPPAEQVPYLLREQTDPPSAGPDLPTAAAPTGTATGTLQIRTSAADGALPVEAAQVRIYRAQQGERVLQYLLQTDRDGLSPSVTLPGIRAAETLEPGAPEAAHTYEVFVEKAGFYSVRHEQIVLYDGIRSRQEVNMIPLPDGMTDTPVRVFTSQQPNL